MIRKTLALVIVGVVALASSSPSSSAQPAPDAVPAGQAQAVRGIVDRVIGKQRLIGVQYAVSRRGRLIAEGVYGQADLDSGVPVTPETTFLIASVAKPMTAAIALRLADRGQLNLDAPVQAYVPDFPVHPDGAVTPRLLINHRGGIRHYARGEPTAQVLGAHYETAHDALAVFKDAAFAAAPGVEERYSSYGYALLAASLESAASTPYVRLIAREVFEPLGMDHTRAPDMRYPTPGRAHSYTYYSPLTGAFSESVLRARDNDYSYNPGGGNVISTARDLVRFGQAFLQPGYLSPEALALIMGEAVNTPPPPGETFVQDAVRYGWLVGHDRSGRRFIHATGASEAYQGGLTIFPDEGLVISALTNTWGVNSRDGGFTLKMHIDIANAVLGP